MKKKHAIDSGLYMSNLKTAAEIALSRPSVFDEPKVLVENFDTVDKYLYRGAQPSKEGFAWLKSIGVKAVICLRGHDVPDYEWQFCSSNGIELHQVPWSPMVAPSKESVNHVISLINTSPKPVFIHCQFGCERTGMAVACYRIRVLRQTNEYAWADALTHGLHSALVVGGREFIKNFT